MASLFQPQSFISGQAPSPAQFQQAVQQAAPSATPAPQPQGPTLLQMLQGLMTPSQPAPQAQARPVLPNQQDVNNLQNIFNKGQ